MRFIQLSTLVVLLLSVAVFALQNNVPVTVQFLAWPITLPLMLEVIGIYFLGMVSGGAVVGFVRRSIQRLSESRSSKG